MPRFLVPPQQIRDGKFWIVGSEAHHLRQVLRKKPGDVIDIFDGVDASYHVRIDSFEGEQVRGSILSLGVDAAVVPVSIWLFQSLIKGPRWEWLLEKASELGVERVIPLQTRRTVVKIDKRESVKLGRWKRIAAESAKQCGRSKILDVVAPVTLEDGLENVPPGTTILFPWENESKRSVGECLQKRTLDSVIPIFIGPEGGWHPSEVELAVSHGACTVHLGPTLLRSETAGLVACTLAFSASGVYDSVSPL